MSLLRREVGNKKLPTFVMIGVDMEKKLEKIKEAIKPEMDKLGISIDTIEYVKESGYNSLNIVLDKVNGLDLDAIVEATNVINPIIDKLDLIDDAYVLDISSKERNE